MLALFASKNTEAKIIASIRSMGAESLNPDDYEDLERILNNMCETRSIDSDAVGIERAPICECKPSGFNLLLCES